jgi:hypothetical protein
MDAKELEAILSHDFVIDCPQIVLEQLTENSQDLEKKVYSGPGTITQDGNGQFFVKVFCDGKPTLSEIMPRNPPKAGQIIRASKFYALSANDLKGTLWQARIMPFITGHLDYDGFLAHGHLRKISCEKEIPLPIKKNHLLITVMGDIEIPCTTGTLIETYVGEEKRASSGRRNVASFKSCDLEFEITKYDKWLTISVTSDALITDALIVRIMEALQFVLGRSLPWTVIEITQEKTLKTHIRPPLKIDIKPRTKPPIQFTPTNTDTWVLFDTYLNHFINFEEESWHPTFNIIHSVIEASSASAEAEVLTISVAVEGLLKTEFHDLGEPDKETKDQIALAKSLIKDSELNRDFKERVFGSLRGMKNTRPEDRLFELKNQGLIEQRLISSWRKLRHSSVHADELNFEELQKYLDRCKTVLVLFYQLIFLAIGYTGKYTDYSTYSFPIKNFDKKMA